MPSSAKNVSTKMNADLQRERSNATFDVEQLTYLLYYGEYTTQHKRNIEEKVFSDKDFINMKDHRFLSTSERYGQAVEKAVLAVKKFDKLGLSGIADEYLYRRAVMVYDNDPLGLHDIMFLPALESLSTEEQKKKWLKMAQKYVIIGTYAQTELGHGTHIRKIETTATYVPQTEEFIIHSPTLSSMKWWPGNMAKTSNHVILMAQLYINAKCYGIHPFFVQIRSLDNHAPMPGIEVGDIGPKMGFDANDNGYLKFNYVRIPRGNMLMRNSQVLKDGTYVKPSSEKLSYGTMMFVRAMIVFDTAIYLAKALTIAIRYSTVRRQSEIEPGGSEPQVLDFVTQQYKLFPLLASAYAFHFAGEFMRDTYYSMAATIEGGDLDLLPELHGLSCCLKALSTWVVSSGIEQCRMCCGGHGYSKASAFPDLYVLATPACTYEGENTVLMLQSARYLVKCFAAAQSGKKLARSVAYLSQPSPASFTFEKRGRFSSAFSHRAKRLVSYAYGQLKRHTDQGVAYERAWNNCSVDLLNAAKAHAEYFMVQNFETVLERDGLNKLVEEVLSSLCELYSLYIIQESAGDFLADGYMNGEQLSLVKRRVVELLAEIRPNAVALVDAFDFRDEMLCSALGAYDGNVYERLYEFAKQSTLNKTEIHPSYYKYLKPMMESARSKL